MKDFLMIGCVVSTLASLLYTANLYANGESWPRIWNETFILWFITLIIFVVYFLKFRKKGKK